MTTLSSKVITPSPEKNILWLNTYYYDSIPYSIANMNSNVVWKSELNKPQYVDIYLQFLFRRISELEFRVTCIQTRSTCLTSSNYHLRIYCSMNVFRKSLKVFQMSNTQDIGFTSYLLDTSYREKYDVNKLFELKIIVKMIEYDCPLADRYLHQERELRLLKEDYFEEYVLQDLCFILNIPKLKDIFTGQQNNEFAEKKREYIRKSAFCSEDIVDYVKAIREDLCMPKLEIERMLNYVFQEDGEPITNEDLTKMYFDGHLLGLQFIVQLCRLLMQHRVWDLASAIDVLLVADRVDDTCLFSEIANFVFCWWKNNSYPEDWLETLKKSNIERKFMADSLEIVLKELKGNPAAEGMTSMSIADPILLANLIHESITA